MCAELMLLNIVFSVPVVVRHFGARGASFSPTNI